MISVVIPTYNRRALVVEAIYSVLQQSVPPGEIIVVDDGSTDDTAEKVSHIARAYPSLRLLRTEHTGRPGAARNRGVESAAGEWIGFLDSDDLWTSQKIEAVLPTLAGGKALAGGKGGQAAGSPGVGAVGLVHTRELWLRSGKTISQKGQNHAREGDVFFDALQKCTIGPSTTVMRRDLYIHSGGFREDLEVAEDYEFWLRVAAWLPVAYVDQPLTVKRAGHGEQLSEKHGQIEGFRIAALKPLVDGGYFEGAVPPWAGAPGPGPGKAAARAAAARAVLAEKCRIYAAGAQKRGRAAEAAEYHALAQHYSR